VAPTVEELIFQGALFSRIERTRLGARARTGSSLVSLACHMIGNAYAVAERLGP